ncbi:MAG: hypothetical protein K6G33_05165 [Ruminococcus sp.]|uniref:hypothetical protein n=1 Tax=Ruminococcus sp. TaxID=41978 RepID=UPI0025E2BEC0|nr:hypothetical protein [Ruminococcus sp.]MCR5600113.1 hypothetical protein [Ruminococcus sp.]
MREYDETTLKVAKRVFEKGDEILAQRRKRAAKIRHITYAFSGMCAAVIVGIGVWRFSSSVKVPYDSDIIASTETTTAQSTVITTSETSTSVTKTTTAPVKSSTATKTAVITSSSASTAFTASHTRLTTTARTAVTATSSSAVTVSSSSNANVSSTALPKTTTKVTLSKGEGAETHTHPENPTEISSEHTTRTGVVVCTTGPHDMSVTTINNTESFDIKEIFRSSAATVEVKTDKLNYYVKQGARVSPERIDRRRIYMSTVKIKVTDSQIQCYTMEVYDLTDTDRNEAVAVRLFDTNEYYLFTNPSYDE